MTNVMIIPDVHGRLFWEEPVKNRIDEFDNIIFLGDYLDPYEHEYITPKQALDRFHDILELKALYPDKVTLLLGNHDHHYMFDLQRGCRMDYLRYDIIKEIFRNGYEFFDLYKVIDDKYLFSHAGVSTEWLSNYKLEDFTIEHCKEDDNISRKLFQIGWERGGDSEYGSIIWRHLTENSTLLPQYYQIFGHTQLRENAIIKDSYSCLDCRKVFKLTNNEITEL
jgi:hypothetical protein